MRISIDERANRADMYARYKQIMATPVKHSKAIKQLVSEEVFDPKDVSEVVSTARYIRKVIRSEKRKEKDMRFRRKYVC